MELIATLLLIVFGILQIILFFKLWGMTNDVAQIKEYIARMDKRVSNKLKSGKAQGEQKDDSMPDWVIGSRVVRIATEEQMKIISLNSNGSFVCTKDGIVAGSYRRDELMTWTEWLEHLKK